MRNINRTFYSLTIATLCLGSAAHASFMPKNDIKIGITDAKNDSIDKSTFNQIIDEVTSTFGPLMEAQGGNLNVEKDWADPEANAYASQRFGSWTLHFTGGLARHPEMTRDGYTLVVCHETGHHLGGYPFGLEPPFNMVSSWGADEGQADYFASLVCARRLWANQTSLNHAAASLVAAPAKLACDSAWKTQADRDLCYRIANGGESLARTLLDLTNQGRVKKGLAALPEVRYDNPDTVVVTKTDNKSAYPECQGSNAPSSCQDPHPYPQCRMDTSLSAATCVAAWNFDVIPGKKASGGNNSLNAERESAKVTCMQASHKYTAGFRPACWFKEQGSRRGGGF